MREKLSQEKITEIVKLRKGGLNFVEIARRVGVSPTAAITYAGNIPAPNGHWRGTKITDANISEIRSLLSWGHTVKEVAAITWISEDVIYKHTKDMRRAMRKAVRLEEEDKQLLADAPDKKKKPTQWTYNGKPLDLFEKCKYCRWRMNKETSTVCGVCYRKVIDRVYDEEKAGT